VPILLRRPSIDPVLMIRMLIVGCVFAIRSERALCRDVRVNLAYRWCVLSIEDKIPDHSAFSLARNERFRNSEIVSYEPQQNEVMVEMKTQTGCSVPYGG